MFSRFSNIKPKFLSPGERSVTLFPSKYIFPVSGLINPAIIFSSVVFPAPVGPKIIKYSLSFISRLIFSRALNFPYDFEIFSSFMVTIIISPHLC